MRSKFSPWAGAEEEMLQLLRSPSLGCLRAGSLLSQLLLANFTYWVMSRITVCLDLPRWVSELKTSLGYLMNAHIHQASQYSWLSL